MEKQSNMQWGIGISVNERMLMSSKKSQQREYDYELTVHAASVYSVARYGGMVTASPPTTTSESPPSPQPQLPIKTHLTACDRSLWLCRQATERTSMQWCGQILYQWRSREWDWSFCLPVVVYNQYLISHCLLALHQTPTTTLIKPRYKVGDSQRGKAKKSQRIHRQTHCWI